MDYASIVAALEALADEADAQHLQRFFKTGPGEYGENDRFRGIRVPALRKLAAQSSACALADSVRLLASPFHEDRMLALLIWMRQVKKGDAASRERVFDLYLEHRGAINNWDLVDVSAPHLLGPFLQSRRERFDALVRSDVLWERRMAMVACFHAIREHRFEQALDYARVLLNDAHDLMHKAVGWMLREVGNRDRQAEERFLQQHYRVMPRTMLRYAIEKFPEQKRLAYLKGTMT